MKLLLCLLFQVQLQSTKQERDIAITKARKLEEELQNLRMYYSLHKSLSQEANLRDKFNNTLGNIEEQVKARDEVLVKAQKDKNHLASQLKISMDERNQVAGELQQSAMMQ
ncbi:mirror-image polydactyly gene 1 protein-like, partial [Anneissia japonica]|uniref:mirror-image polydactyly gene 1 protein-like n=1 Tax=Anneissia japonica TaxID=1529436 RepID=UPI00142554BA